MSGSTVYAGGAFTAIGGKIRHRIAALSSSSGAATAWNPNANGEVLTLALSGSTLYAGGYFSSIGGQAQWSHLARFSPLPKPVLGALRPARGAVGATVTITGSGFGARRGTARVFFAGKAATRYVSWSATRIKVKVPRLAKGRKTVKVVTAGGKSAAKTFRVT